MTPRDHERFRELIVDFARGLPFPFHLVCIDAVGQVAVTHHSGTEVEPVCCRVTGPALVSPLTVTIITPGAGVGRSTVISIEARPSVMQ